MEPIKVFVSYARKDEEYKDELLIYLAPMMQAGRISIWSDDAIIVGDKWDEKIKTALDDCEIILFLLSPYFLASNYINKVEITKAMKRHKDGTLRLVPVMLSECDLSSHIIKDEEDRISDFEGLPENMKPVEAWSPISKGWMSVVNGLKKALDEMQNNPANR